MMRLNADYEKIRNEFLGHRYVKVDPIGPVPPEMYRITYRVPGIAWDSSRNQPVRINEHIAEIYLHQNYPREKPKSELKTPIFHPNFGSYICIGDHWAAGETLVDIIVQIGDMIQYKTYNPKSPLNAAAARWSVQNKHLFPLGNIDILQPEPEVDFGGNDSKTGEDDLGIILGPKPKDDDDLKIEFL